MKKLLSIAATAAVLALASCGNNRDQSAADAEKQMQAYKDSIRLASDTAGLTEYRTWKAQNELALDSQYQEQQYAPATAAASTHKSTARRYSSTPRRSRSYSSSSSSGGSYSSTSSNTAKANRGWSKAAKGAVIGGAGGAITGAVINKKNRAAGAVVGGVVGGVVGYGIGRHKDKKDGRY